MSQVWSDLQHVSAIITLCGVISSAPSSTSNVWFEPIFCLVRTDPVDFDSYRSTLIYNLKGFVKIVCRATLYTTLKSSLLSVPLRKIKFLVLKKNIKCDLGGMGERQAYICVVMKSYHSYHRVNYDIPPKLASMFCVLLQGSIGHNFQEMLP